MSTEAPVYQPAEDTWLLIDCLSGIEMDGWVVEVGCGSGEVSRSIIERGVEVVAIDVSEAAARRTRQNCSRLAERLHVIVGDRLKAIRPSKKISLIASNPPYLPSEDLADDAIEAGPTGAEFAISLIDEAESFMSAGAKMALIASTLGNIEAITEYAESKGLKTKLLASRHLFFEEIRCYEITKGNKNR